jgi:hypothetical protein
MARLSVVQCDRCFIRTEAGHHDLPKEWCVLTAGILNDVLLLCGECSEAFVQFMGEIEKAAKPEEPGSKVE